MADETSTPNPPAPETPAPTKRQLAIQAYYDAVTPAEKRKVLQQYPVLATIFSEANHPK